MTTHAQCPRCAAPLPGGPGSLCVVCAGRLALDSDDRHATADAPGLGVLLGDYELLSELGRGTMGVVYRARQLCLKREVALKVVLSGQFASEAERKRFLAEAELAATLDHPGIVPVYEVGSAEGRPFCAMKLVEGRSLSVMLGEGFCSRRQCEAHCPPPKLLRGIRGCCVTAAALTAKVARAVHHAHQRGIIHRDLKPANILVDAAGEPHITDFGLARRLGTDSSLTLTGSPLGTPAYMSPEQARGEKTITTASDIWSLGVILYELLAGRPPFAAQNVPALLRKIAEEEPAPFAIYNLRFTSQQAEAAASGTRRDNRQSQIANPIDPDLATICLKCLEKDLARRYASAAELADDLDRWQRNEPILARRSTTWERALKWTARHPRQASMVLLLHVLFVAGLSGVLWQWRRAERETELVRQTAAREAAALLRNETAKDAFLEQARAFRTSGQPGARSKALEALATAARIRPGMELRNEALAALALPDLLPAGSPIPFTEATGNVGFDLDVRRAVAVGLSEQLRLMSLSDGTLITNWSVRGQPYGWLTFSPDGGWLAARNMSEAMFWNLATCRQSSPFSARLGVKHQHGLEFSPDSLRIAITDGNDAIAILDLKSGEVEREIKLAGPVDAFAFSPEGSHLAVLARRSLQIRSLSDGAEEARFLMPPGSWVSWQADGGRLFVVSPGNVVRVVDPGTGLVRTLVASQALHFDRAVPHPRGAWLVTASPQQTGSGLWDAATGRFLFSIADGAFHFSRDGRRLGCVRRKEGLVVWDVIEADGMRSFPGPTNAVLDLDASPDGRWLASAGEDGVRLWKLSSGQEVDFAPLPGAWRIGFQPDGDALLVHGISNAWRLPLQVKDRRFCHETGFGEPQVAQISDLLYHRFPIGNAEIGATNRAAHLRAEIILASRIRLTDTRNGKLLADLAPPHGGTLERVFLSRDGQRVMAVSEDELIHVWNLPRLRSELARLGLDWGGTNGAALPIPAARPPLVVSPAPSPSQSPTRPERFDARGFPVRDPMATTNQIDLTRHYNASLTENWMGSDPQVDDTFGSLPRGLQTLGGVPFDVRGVVQLTANRDDPAVRKYPTAVREIAVAMPCRRLHVLMAARWGLEKYQGQSAAHFILRFADGQSVTNPITAGVELGDAWHWPGRTFGATKAEVVWRGANQTSADSGATLHLFHWALDNPRPDVSIATLDFVSTLSPVAPFLIALTAETAEAPFRTSSLASQARPPNRIGAPPRDPLATTNQIDLTPFYNALLTERNWINARATIDEGLRTLPTGLQTLSGVAFDVRGIVQLGSLGTWQYSDDFPAAVSNIPIRRVCRRLHFLTAAYCFFPIDQPGLRVGHYLMHYADGQSVEIPLRLDEELGMLTYFPKLGRRARLAEVVWTGDEPWTFALGGSLQLFKWTWENPRPGVELTSLDFVSAQARPAPLLIALTAE